MAEKLSKLSLQALYELIQTKADQTHTHLFSGSIESALMLAGVPAKSFMRNDLADQQIRSFNDSASLAVESLNTSIKLEAGRRQAALVVGDQEMSKHSLTITGSHREDVQVNVIGGLMVNNNRVLTVDEANQLTGINFDDLDIQGKGIVVSAEEPLNPTDGMIWAQIVEDDLVDEQLEGGPMRVLSLPLGTIVESLSTVVPNGFIPADGSLVSRNVYEQLWAFVKTKTRLLDDAEWRARRGQNNRVDSYSSGDKQATFRVPFLPTGGSTVKLIKAYEEPTTQGMLNLMQLQNDVAELSKSRVTMGVGFLKFTGGTLIQHGTTFNNTAYFSIPFIDDQYTVIFNHDDPLLSVALDPASRQANLCSATVLDDVGLPVTAPVAYLAIGRWC